MALNVRWKRIHCSALSAGTAALHLAVKLLEVGEGDTVICPSLTFAATVNPVAYEKGKIVFVDSEPETWNMSPQALKRALEEHKEAKAVIVAHLYGTPAKVDEIKALCEEYKVPLIEDAAESLGPMTQEDLEQHIKESRQEDSESWQDFHSMEIRSSRHQAVE